MLKKKGQTTKFKIMNTDQIGVYAGQVWQVLNQAVAMGTKQLKKESKLKTDKELFAAIGWLAREGKITIQTNPDDEKELIFTLIQD